MASMAHADPRILAEGSVKKTDSPEKIKDAAQQFEGLLLSQILSTVHEDGGWLGSGSDSSSSRHQFRRATVSRNDRAEGRPGLVRDDFRRVTTAERRSSRSAG